MTSGLDCFPMDDFSFLSLLIESSFDSTVYRYSWTLSLIVLWTTSYFLYSIFEDFEPSCLSEINFETGTSLEFLIWCLGDSTTFSDLAFTPFWPLGDFGLDSIFLSTFNLLC